MAVKCWLYIAVALVAMFTLYAMSVITTYIHLSISEQQSVKYTLFSNRNHIRELCGEMSKKNRPDVMFGHQ